MWYVGLAVVCSWDFAFFLYTIKAIYTIHLCIVCFNISSVHLCIIAPQNSHGFKRFPNKSILLSSRNGRGKKKKKI